MEKEVVIEKINKIIDEHGTFTVFDVEADHSPIVPSKSRLSHLMEEFREDGGIVRVYDPSSYSSDEIDEYDDEFEAMELSQLEYILSLAEEWKELSMSDEV